MDWTAVKASPVKLELAKALAVHTPILGWNRQALDQVSRAAVGDPDGWRPHFPKGARDAIWFISEVSDRSMFAAFLQTPAADMAQVIATRFVQNSDLKPFVRGVMRFDLLHPLQALARMQRTARVMAACLAPSDRPPGRLRLTALNLLYTTVVFVWLGDDSIDQQSTAKFIRAAMAIVRL
jgi:hypothetical protein